MSYLVFARKWRPKSFDEVVGQEHIATILKNALKLGRVAHAYLFSGPRGVGKTTTARILARALNCEKGPAVEPCNTCSFCTEISEGRSLDVIEIDGASNRGIEQIRQLRENVKFAPAKNRFKIYIIDEVHQITPDGFNALLKTLEEPPAHIKFIFATTEAHKVIPTILSRCQRFDFKALSIASIMQKLKGIVQAEKLDVTEDALLYIARAASGSMRDAESLLDQMSSFCKDKITLETVNSVLGTIDFEGFWEISQKIIERKTADTLILIERVINEGKDLSQFIAGLMEHFRNILVSRVVSEKNKHNLINLPEDALGRIYEQGKDLSFEELFYIFNILTRAQEKLKRSLSARVIVEMALVKLTKRENISSLENIISRIAALEQKLESSNFTQEEVPHQAAPIDEPSLEADAPRTTSATSVSKDLNHNWIKLLEAIKEKKIFLASSLEMGELAGVVEGVLTVAFAEKDNFYKENLEQPENKKMIEAKAKEVFGRELKIDFVLDKKLQPPKEASPKFVEQPVIQSALKIFEGRIVKRGS
ncbi:MAG: DNA polymerase III subunit gamma/tau [Candidatus Omnitrophota bacterium]|nr:MAG: DNA polymerase III subunit gamma/tau [Candidatus Omnitrophota bacterium]